MPNTREIPLYITKNVAFVQDIEVNGIDNPNEPFDLTGYVTQMFIAKYYDSTTKYSVPTLIPNPTDGKIRISISGNSTAQLPTGSMVYSLFAQRPNDDRIIVIKGPVFLMPTVG